MTTLRDLYDMAIGVDTLIPAGRTPRWIADKFGLVVPETSDPPGLIRAADRLHENASRLRESIEGWHQGLLAVAGAAHPTVMAGTVILAQPEWTAFAASVTAYRKQRELYVKLAQLGANQLALLEARR